MPVFAGWHVLKSITCGFFWSIKNGLVRHHCFAGCRMAHFLRLIVLAFLCCCGLAHASFVAPFIFYSSNGPGGASAHFPSAQALCDNAKAWKQANYPAVTVYMKGVPSVAAGCVVAYMQNSVEYTNTYAIGSFQQCPANTTGPVSACSCVSEYVQDGTLPACKPKPPPPDVCDPLKKLPTPLPTYETFVKGMDSAAAKQALGKPRDGCLSGCIFSANTSASATGPDGTIFVMSDGKFSGLSCPTGTPDTGLGPISSRCSSQGMCVGTVNSVEVCVKCTSTSTSDTTLSTPLPAASAPYNDASAPIPANPASSPGGGGGGGGSDSSTGTTYGKSPLVSSPPGEGSSVPGGSATQTQTQCTSNSCTTTTQTSTNMGDGTYKNSSVEQVMPKADFCKDNPLNKSCLDGGGSFGGACAAGFTCQGDTLMCAMAREQYTRNCALFETPSAESALYDAAKTLDKTKAVIDATEVNISSASFDQTNAFGAGTGCIADKTITVMSSSVTLPFSSVCRHLEYIGYINMAVAFLIAGRIVSRG